METWIYFAIFVGVVIAVFAVGAMNGYRNGMNDGRALNASRETKQLELLVRMLVTTEGSDRTRASRVVSETRRYLETHEKTKWIRSMRFRNTETREEDTFQKDMAE